MSTKSRLIEAVKAIWHNEDATDTMHQRVPVLIEELEIKKKTPITRDIFKKNGFKEFRYGKFREEEFFVAWDEDYGWCWGDTSLHSVADLEDALELCGIDKEINCL